MSRPSRSSGSRPGGTDPLVDEIARQVAAVPDLDPRTATSKARVLHELQRLPRPFDEHADPVHVTASAIVVGPRGTVLHLHKRLRRWMQPGGHIDAGEHPAEAALREVAEETGLAPCHAAEPPVVRHVDVHDGGRGHTHLDLRYLLHAEGDPCPSQGESPQVAWFPWDEAIGLADDGLITALGALRPDGEAPAGPPPERAEAT